jgi:hypothetical protein
MEATNAPAARLTATNTSIVALIERYDGAPTNAAIRRAVAHAWGVPQTTVEVRWIDRQAQDRAITLAPSRRALPLDGEPVAPGHYIVALDKAISDRGPVADRLAEALWS